MTYIVVTNPNMQEFVEEVNAWISQGFKPLGGPTTTPLQNEAAHIMIQALTKD